MRAEAEEGEEEKKETDREADCCVKGQNAFNQLQLARRKKRKQGEKIQEPAPSIHYERQTPLLRRSGETRQD